MQIYPAGRVKPFWRPVHLRPLENGGITNQKLYSATEDASEPENRKSFDEGPTRYCAFLLRWLESTCLILVKGRLMASGEEEGLFDFLKSKRRRSAWVGGCRGCDLPSAIQTLYDSGALKPPTLLVTPNDLTPQRAEIPVEGDLVKGNSSGATGIVVIVRRVGIAATSQPSNGEVDSSFVYFQLALKSVSGTFTADDNAATMSKSGGTVAVKSYTPSTPAYQLLGLPNPRDPGFSKPGDSRSDSITVQQLLNHEGGFISREEIDFTYRLREIALELDLHRPMQKLDIAKYHYRLPLRYDPGTGGLYSNYGYVLLSAIIEQVTGMPYFKFIQEKVLAPLGIMEVLLSSTEAQKRDPNQAICED
jgi:Beta-lactamase